MAEKKSERGSTIPSVLLAVFLVAFTLITIYLFAARTWWFPEAVTALGRSIDAQFMRTLWITGIAFFLSQLALAFVLVRFRDRGGRAQYSHGNNTMEILWTAVTAITFVGLGIAAESAWATYHRVPREPATVRIEVTGQQFVWNFRYPGADGQFGRTAPQLMNDAGGNPLGLDLNDPAAQDDIVTPTMAVPVNQEVELLLKAKDVTHSFFVRELRFKQDTTPGMVIPMRFKADKTGEYEVVCAELCGLGHHRMRTVMLVLPPEEYLEWLREQAEF